MKKEKIKEILEQYMKNIDIQDFITKSSYELSLRKKDSEFYLDLYLFDNEEIYNKFLHYDNLNDCSMIKKIEEEENKTLDILTNNYHIYMYKIDEEEYNELNQEKVVSVKSIDINKENIEIKGITVISLDYFEDINILKDINVTWILAELNCIFE